MRPQTINLKCINCGAKLSITPDIDRFACGYCGHELIVQRSGGIVALKDVSEAIKSVQKGTDKTAAELAIKRLTREIEVLEKEKTNAIAELQAKCSNINLFVGLAIAGIATTGLIIFAVISVKSTAYLGSNASGGVITLALIVTIIISFILGKKIHKKFSRNTYHEMNVLADNYDARLKKLKKQLWQNRQIVDS